jgi:hypothetical protein
MVDKILQNRLTKVCKNLTEKLIELNKDGIITINGSETPATIATLLCMEIEKVSSIIVTMREQK